MFGSFQALCCASSTSFVAMAARALGPTAASWTRLPGYFAPVSGSWLKKDLIIDGVLRYAGEGWPTNCMDTCFAVKECHGFNIDRDGLCSFRSESPDEIRANAERPRWKRRRPVERPDDGSLVYTGAAAPDAPTTVPGMKSRILVISLSFILSAHGIDAGWVRSHG